MDMWFAIFLAIFLAYVFLMIAASLLCFFRKKPEILYHCCKTTSVNKIYLDKKFITKTEGRAYFSPKKDNDLGLSKINLKSLHRRSVNLLIWMQNIITNKSKKLIPKPSINTSNVIFQGNSLGLLNSIFHVRNIYHIFNIWGAIKFFRNEWVTSPLHNIILTKCYLDKEGNCVVEDARLEKKQGFDYFFCLSKVIGMILLNLNLSFCFISSAVTYFYPNWYSVWLFSAELFLLFIPIIVAWFIVNHFQNK